MLEDPLHNIFMVDYNMDTAKPALQQGWSSLAEYYGLSDDHWCMLKMVEPCHFHMTIALVGGDEIRYYRALYPPSPPPSPVFLPEDVDDIFADLPNILPGEMSMVELDQEVPAVVSSPQSVLMNNVEDEQVVPEHYPAPNGVAEGVLLEYQMGFNTVISPYRAYGSQYVSKTTSFLSIF